MSFTITFPSLNDPESNYTGLIEEHEVYEAVVEEVKKSISDMGSEGYDPDSFLDQVAYARAMGQGDSDKMNELWQEATTKAIDHQVTLHAPQIFKDLWLRYPAGEPERGPVTTSKLPDGVTIKMEEVED